MVINRAPLLLLLLLLLLRTRQGAHALNLTTFAPSPVPLPPPLPASEVFVLLDQRLYNESASVPAWARTDADATLPPPTLVAADDFFVPAALTACQRLVVDVPLLRAMGRTAANYRVPARATLWLWDDADFELRGTFANTSAGALASVNVTVPLEPASPDWTSAAGGYTVTQGGHYRIEPLRFEVPLPRETGLLGGGRRYWIGLAVALDRAFSSADFSHNEPRWMTSPAASVRLAQQLNAGNATLPYRVVDANAALGAPMFRDAPALARWTAAGDAEPTVLPFMTGGALLRSVTQQLALGVFATECTSASASAARQLYHVSAMPPRVLDLVAKAQWDATVASPPPALPSSPSTTTPSPAAAVAPPWQYSPSQPRLLVVSPVSIMSPHWVPAPRSLVPSTQQGAIVIGVSPVGTTPLTVSEPPAFNLMWAVIVGAAVMLLVIVAVLVVGVRYYRRRYEDKSYTELMTMADAGLLPRPDEGDSARQAATRVTYQDDNLEADVIGHSSPIVDLDADADDPPAIRDIKDRFDEATMVAVPLDAPPAPKA